MRLTPRTPRRVVRRFVWSLVEAGAKVSFHLGGEGLMRRFVYGIPERYLQALARADLRDDALDRAHGVSGS